MTFIVEIPDYLVAHLLWLMRDPGNHLGPKSKTGKCRYCAELETELKNQTRWTK